MKALVKLSKDQIQKVFLSLIGFCLLVFVYFTFFLGPLTRSRTVMEQRMADLQGKLGSSKTELRRVTSLERTAGAATSRYKVMQGYTPDGAPIAWFPPRIKSFFADERIDKAAAHLGSNVDPKEPELSGWSKYSWLISLPEADYAALGKAIADLENSEPLLWIERLTIHAQPEQLQYQQVDLVADHIIKKK
jgi:hypothetical protein